MASKIDEALGFEAFMEDAEDGEAGRAQAVGDNDRRELYRRVFGTTEGMVVLADLYREFVHGARWQPGEPTECAFVRDGSASVVCHIGNLANGPDMED